MKLKERIQLALQEELQPLGFRYIKTRTTFERNVDKNITAGLVYVADCFHHGFTDINLISLAEYHDIGEALYKLLNKTIAKDRHFGLIYQLPWLMPLKEKQFYIMDSSFRDSDSEDIFNKKLEKLIYQMRKYSLPTIERMSHKDSAIEVAIELDRKDLIFQEGVVPVMYCIWKHDKKAALDYLEEKRLRLLKRVEPWEWDLVERYRKGERFGRAVPIPNGMQYRVGEPFNALSYDDFMGFVNKFNEWLESDMNPIRADL